MCPVYFLTHVPSYSYVVCWEVIDEETVSIEEAFDDLYKDIGKPAMLLRGFRKRDELTQAQLAKKLDTTQSAIAEMENGQRKIGLKMEKKIAAFFEMDYKELI